MAISPVNLKPLLQALVEEEAAQMVCPPEDLGHPQDSFEADLVRTLQWNAAHAILGALMRHVRAHPEVFGAASPGTPASNDWDRNFQGLSSSARAWHKVEIKTLKKEGSNA